MFIQPFPSNLKKSQIAFAVGLCLVIVSGWIHIFPSVRTTMFTWRVELAASIFIAAVSVYFLGARSSALTKIKLSPTEIYLIVLPLTAFILWSGVSAFWALSWKSALHHTAFWSIYLVFYIAARQLLNVNGSYRLVTTCLIFLLMLIAIPVIIEYGSYLYLNSATTLGIRFSKYAEIFNLISPLLIAAVVRMKKRQFAVGAFCAAVMWLFIISTLSRTALILYVSGILMMTGVIFIFKQFKKYRRKMALLILIMIISSFSIHLISVLTTDTGIPIINRVNDSVGMSNSNNSRKLLATIALEMFKQKPLTGVGADNFGIELNNYRIVYGEKHPDDINLATGEPEIAERAHNEYLQIISELGAIGGFIFLCFLMSIAALAINLFKQRKHASLFPFAAMCGIFLFLISSTVSSYSFRLTQNGLIFLFVLAVAAKFLLPVKKSFKTSQVAAFGQYFYKPVFGLAVLLCLLLGTHCIMRATSAYYSEQLLSLTDASKALILYENAVWFDDENLVSYLGYGLYLINEGRYNEAVPNFNQAIKYGEATSATYSLLATAQYLGGDVEAACRTLGETVKIYPHSTFARTRYAALLQQAGQTEKSAGQMDISLQIDRKSTKTWWSLMHEGVAKTNVKTLKDPDFIVVFDLQPKISYTAFMIERLILHPEERPNIKFLAEN